MPHLVPRNDGRVLCGSTKERVGFVAETTAEGLALLRARADRLCPPLASVQVARSWAGLRPAVQRQLPVIGPSRLAGLYFALGHYTHGILLAPVTAELVTACNTGTRFVAIFSLG
jgi:glycine/D-amino acid oxidase-like deaminating enzyme